MVKLVMFTQNIDFRIESNQIKTKDFEKQNYFVQEIIDIGIKVA